MDRSEEEAKYTEQYYKIMRGEIPVTEGPSTLEEKRRIMLKLLLAATASQSHVGFPHLVSFKTNKYGALDLPPGPSKPFEKLEFGAPENITAKGREHIKNIKPEIENKYDQNSLESEDASASTNATAKDH